VGLLGPALLLAGLLAAGPPAAGVPIPAPAAAPGADDGWAALRQLRSRLEAQPQAAEFRQEYLPAGFSSGDSETGRLTLALPGCLRWDYDEPFAKSYLLCEETVWTWNPGESSGRTFAVDPEEDRGLDLLRLGVERLAERYTAELFEGPAGAPEIRLEPRGPATEIVAAALRLTAADGSLSELTYRDVEGNTTRFTFAATRPLAPDAADLRPPGELTWIEE
jgi:hypothetical protein